MTTVDPAEVERFSALAQQWWDPFGKFKPLHKFNPVRLSYIKSLVVKHFHRSLDNIRTFEGLRVLDIGCGGGLLCEPLARLGANVVGVDPSDTNIVVAGIHAQQSNLTIDYKVTTAEALADTGEIFDIVLAMEVVEHVSDVSLFLTSCAQMVRPGGIMIVATINRTLKAWAMAIVGAEYILRWLPKGTHQYDKFVRSEEIEKTLITAGLDIVETTGVSYYPLQDCWQLSKDIQVNYMILAHRLPLKDKKNNSLH